MGGRKPIAGDRRSHSVVDKEQESVEEFRCAVELAQVRGVVFQELWSDQD
jgi:hypothetical protein